MRPSGQFRRLQAWLWNVEEALALCKQLVEPDEMLVARLKLQREALKRAIEKEKSGSVD